MEAKIVVASNRARSLRAGRARTPTARRGAGDSSRRCRGCSTVTTPPGLTAMTGRPGGGVEGRTVSDSHQETGTSAAGRALRRLPQQIATDHVVRAPQPVGHAAQPDVRRRDAGAGTTSRRTGPSRRRWPTGVDARLPDQDYQPARRDAPRHPRRRWYTSRTPSPARPTCGCPSRCTAVVRGWRQRVRFQSKQWAEIPVSAEAPGMWSCAADDRDRRTRGRRAVAPVAVSAEPMRETACSPRPTRSARSSAWAGDRAVVLASTSSSRRTSSEASGPALPRRYPEARPRAVPLPVQSIA
jgi:hypothetical protein